MSRCRIVARSPVSTAVLISLRPSIKALKVLMIAGRFSAQISSQIAGCPEAMRVMSRKPPAAKRNNAACSVARDPATPIKVAAVRCGTWLTMATNSSWRTGSRPTTSAPRSLTIFATVANAASEVVEVGVRTHTAPVNSSPSAPSSPSSSLPAIG